jgi:hypothetical protein
MGLHRVTNGILASLLHEMEHDLIHSLYYKNSARVQNFMFWVVWLFRGNTVNPWFRKEIHLLHHRVSGHKNDVEERYISNGMPWGLKRVLVMLDPLAALTIQGPKIKRDALPELRRIKAPHKIIPLQRTFMLLWYSFLLLSLTRLGFFLAGVDFAPPAWLAPDRHVSEHCGSRLPDTLLAAAGRDSDRLFEHALLRRRRERSAHRLSRQADAGFEYVARSAAAPVLLQLRRDARHSPLCRQPAVLPEAMGSTVRHKALRRYGVRFNDFASMRRANGWLARNELSAMGFSP